MCMVTVSVVDVVMFSVTILELCLERGKLDLMNIYGV